MRFWLYLWIFTLLLFVGNDLAPSADRPLPPSILTSTPLLGIQVTDRIVTGQGGNSALHALILGPHQSPATLLPAVVYIHGGGWMAGDYHDSTAAFLVSHGYIVVSIEYRLSPVAPWPAQIEDCKLGVRWLRAHAAQYHIDPNRIAAMGHSAGGHLAACLGTMGDEAAFEGSGGWPGVSSHVQAVVDIAGPTSFEQPARVKGMSDHARSVLTRLFGGSFAEHPDLWRQGSPVVHVRAGDPPFLIIHGDHDSVVNYAQASAMTSALKQARVPVKLLTVEGGEHGLSPAPGFGKTTPSVPEVRERIAAFLDRVLKK